MMTAVDWTAVGTIILAFVAIVGGVAIIIRGAIILISKSLIKEELSQGVNAQVLQVMSSLADTVNQRLTDQNQRKD